MILQLVRLQSDGQLTAPRLQERRWWYIREGRASEYHGLAVHPRHLSMWERYVLHIDRQYNYELDTKQRAQELVDMRAVQQVKPSAC